MAERASDRWISIVLSVLLHGALLAAVGYGWWTYKKERPQPTLAIEATVVDARSVTGVGKQPPQPPPPAPVMPPEPPPPVEEPTGPPQPTPEELAKREQAQKEQAEREAQQKRQAEDQQRKAQEQQQEAALAEEKRADDKRAEDKRAEEKRQADEQRKAQEKAETDRKAREAADAKKRADEKRLEDQKRQADEQAKADREAELKRSLDQEMRADAARSSGALASWVSQITARIQRAWLKPPSAKTGIECVLYVTQVPGGEVTNVRIGACNGDQAVRESIEAAVYRASPLPPPSDPTLFERDLVITFRPN
jgi:colicin import membrane protein